MLGRSTLPREGHGRLAAGEPTGLSPVALDALRRVVAKLESDVANGPIVPSVTPLEIRGYLASRYDFTKPLALDDVSADVERMLRTWQVQVTHPRYFGLFNPSVTLASIVGDTLVAMYNPQLATWRTSPAANEIERHTLAWLAGKFGFAADAVASFTNGGAEANLSAVVVALTRASGAISPASRPPIRSRATRTNGSRCRWRLACSSAAMPTPSARPSAWRPPTCPGPLPDPSLIHT